MKCRLPAKVKVIGRKFIATALKQITQRVKFCPQCVRLVLGDKAADLKRAERNHGPRL